jgi:hypothetical protein
VLFIRTLFDLGVEYVLRGGRAALKNIQVSWQLRRLMADSHPETVLPDGNPFKERNL